jgi:uncharacterized membrane protein YdjX (TVP38/TMEM64 family)
MPSPLGKSVLVVVIVLVVPLAMLACYGEAFARVLQQWQVEPPGKPLVGLAVFAMLASDVVLPVPSGPLSTFAGSQLGWAWGWGACWSGMTAGAAVAFALARRWGRPLAVRLAGETGVAAAEQACARHGAWWLLASRPVPIVAEAGALAVGALGLSWRRFWPPVLVGNGALAAAYVGLGQLATEQGWLPLAICLTAALPLALGAWRRSRSSSRVGPPAAPH